MWFYDRSIVPPPESFRSSAAREERLALAGFMRESEERRSQASPPPQSHSSTANVEALVALNDLFRGKCAFCESKAPINVHFFRPPEEAEPLARSQFSHLYYVWLRTDWGNVYAICSHCAAASRTRFPVQDPTRGRLPTVDELESFANENYGLWRWKHMDGRLLLDPCEDRSFVSHLSFNLNGGIQAFTKKGARTIEIFDLDREPLMRARAATFKDYVDLLQEELERDAAPNAFDFASMEFGGAWYLLLRRILNRVGARMDRSIKTGHNQVRRQVEQIWSTPIGRDAFRAALDDVQEPIESRTVRRPPDQGKVRRLTSVLVKNFKALENLQVDIPLHVIADREAGREAEAATLLVLGENAAGKSTILEAVALALCNEKIRQRLERPPESFILDPELMGSPGHLRPQTSSVHLTFEDGETLSLTITDQFEESGARENLPPVFAYGAFRQYATGLARRQPPGNVITLFRSEVVLANPESWLLDLPDEQFAMVIRALKQILTLEGEFDVVHRDHLNRRCLIVTHVGDGEDRREVKTPLSVVSSGFRSVLAMICDVLRGLLQRQTPTTRQSFAEIEAVLLIDEIEAHLHPRWKMQIMTALRRVLPNAVIVATTHDPLCLRGMHDGEVVVFNRAPKTEEIRDSDLPVFVETLVQLPNVENLTVEQLLTSDFFAMFSTDSPAAELHMARLSNLLARDSQGIELTPAEASSLQALERQVLDALPLGSSEVQRLVLEAVANYLQQRRKLSVSRMSALREDTKAAIVRALEDF